MRLCRTLNGSVLVSSIRSITCSADFKGPLEEIATYFDDPSLPSLSSLLSASSPLSSSYSSLVSSCSSEIPVSLLCEEFISLLPDLSFVPTPIPVKNSNGFSPTFQSLSTLSALLSLHDDASLRSSILHSIRILFQNSIESSFHYGLTTLSPAVFFVDFDGTLTPKDTCVSPFPRFPR